MFTLKIISDDDKKMISCFGCLVQNYFKNANIVVGAHGAGMANSISMAPSNVIIELMPRFRDTAIPHLAPFSPFDNWAMALGFHHYMYSSYSPKGLNVTGFISESINFLLVLCSRNDSKSTNDFNMKLIVPKWCKMFLQSVIM